MPRQNQFRHQQYSAWKSPPIPTSVEAVRPEPLPSVAVGDTMRELRVRRVLLVHGTFVGSDPFGVAAKLDAIGQAVGLLRRLPLGKVSESIRSLNRTISERLIGESAKYLRDYADEFQSMVSPEATTVERFEWSSGNEHFARADAAVKLFQHLIAPTTSDRPFDFDQDRVLLWGHSHAGNVFAILTNLLANDRAAVEAFIAAGRSAGGAAWDQALATLRAAPSPHPLAKGLCIVTFGTPVRYGWDRDGYSRLLHVVQHRPQAGQPPWQTKPAWPQHPKAILGAEFGDWVQSFGIAGTDLLPMDSKTRQAHQNLKSLLETGLPAHAATPLWRGRWPLPTAFQDLGNLHDRLACGQRVPADGQAAWLLDYGVAEKGMCGHGVYTKRAWLPFHATRIAEWLRQTMES